MPDATSKNPAVANREPWSPLVSLVFMWAQLLGCVVFVAMGDLNHDSVWYLTATQEWLSGATLYQDVIEVNPPIAFYWSLPAVWLAQFTGLRLDLCFIVFVGALAAVSTLLIFRVLESTESLSENERFWVLQAAWVCSMWFPMSGFGQREHLMLLCLLPYLFIVFARQQGTRIGGPFRAAVAVFATIGLILKPHFFVIPLFVSVAEAIAHRSLRPILRLENWIMFAGGVSYALFIQYFHADYLQVVVPTAIEVYSAYRLDPVIVLGRMPITLLVTIGGIGYTLSRCGGLKGTWCFLCAAFGGAVCYYIQFTGFCYQTFPFFTLGALFCALSFVLARRNQVVQCLAAVGVLAAIACGPPPARYHNDAKVELCSQLPAFDSETSVMIFSTRVSDAFPFAMSNNVHWPSRFCAQWLLPGALISKAAGESAGDSNRVERSSQILADARQANVEDMLRHRPEYVIVDNRDDKSYFSEGSFDYIAFMLEDEQFAEVWKCYRPFGTPGTFRYWRLKSESSNATNVFDR